MALSKNFKFLDKQTNSPIANLSALTGNEIINSADNAAKELSEALSDFTDSFKEKFNDLGLNESLSELKNAASAAKDGLSGAASQLDSAKSQLTDLYNSATQGAAAIEGAVNDAINSAQNMAGNALAYAKDAVGNAIGGSLTSISNGISSLAEEAGFRYSKTDISAVMNLGKNATSELEKYVGSLLPSGVSSSAVSKLAKRCKNSLGSQGPVGAPWDLSGKCGSGRGKDGCTSGGINNVLDSLSGGGYKSAYRDVSAAISGIVGLSNLSYKINLCGAFTALAQASGYLTGSQLSRAGAGVLSSLSSTGNILGMADLAKSTQGMNLVSMIPNSISRLFSNVSNIAERNSLDTAVSGFAGAELLNSSWLSSDDDDSDFSLDSFENASAGTINLAKSVSYSSNVKDLDDFGNDDDYGSVVYSCLASDNAPFRGGINLSMFD